MSVKETEASGGRRAAQSILEGKSGVRGSAGGEGESEDFLFIRQCPVLPLVELSAL